ALDRGTPLARGPVPELRRFLVAAGGEELAVRRKGHRLHCGAVSRQRDKQLAGSRLPHFRRTVVAARRDVSTVSRIDHIGECQRVSLLDDAWLAVRGHRVRTHDQEPAERRAWQCKLARSYRGRDLVFRGWYVYL